MPVHRQRLTSMQAVADIIRTTLGPRSMLKMLLDASGGGISEAFVQSLVGLGEW